MGQKRESPSERLDPHLELAVAIPVLAGKPVREAAIVEGSSVLFVELNLVTATFG
jgi:hypothetical protein